VDPKVNAVDWVERIPFAETCNYVQRVMENLQVYCARFGASTATVQPNLHRGDGRVARRAAPMGSLLRGLPDQARRTVERALVLARSLSHPPSIVHGHAIAG
jgi:hypothetical protein